MIEVLADNTLLTLFIVIALGAAFGAIPFGPLRFGAAGALFVGLAVGAFVPGDVEQLGIIQELGLGLFVYMVGLEAGETFFKEIRKQFGLMLAAIAAVTAAAAVAVIAGGLFGLQREVSVGVFAGTLTSTPSLALATEQSGSDLPAVGYSLGYPTGVILAILFVAFVTGRNWRAKRDRVNIDDTLLRSVWVTVEHPMTVQEFRDTVGTHVLPITSRRGDRSTVLSDNDLLASGDEVHIYAPKSSLKLVEATLGSEIPVNPRRNPDVALQRFTVSNRDIAGHLVGDLDLFEEHGSRVTRVCRADEEYLASDTTAIELGDVVEVAYPIKRKKKIVDYFGNSVRDAAELDSVAAAGGLVLGFLVGLIQFPLPDGSSFSLGAAAGPLIVGLILGAVRRTGLTWQLPRPANYTIRQFGLMIFLAAVGIASGPAFADTAFTLSGLTAVALAAMVSVIGCGLFLVFAWLLGQSSQRSGGAVAGFVGQPAILQFALSRSSDLRVTTGYATTFAVSLIYKIVLVPFMLAV